MFPLINMPLSFCAQQAWLSTRGRRCTTSSCDGGPSTCTGMSRATTRPRTWRSPTLAPGRSGCPWWLSDPQAPLSPPSWGRSPGPASVWPPSALVWGPGTPWAGTVTRERWWSVWRRCRAVPEKVSTTLEAVFGITPCDFAVLIFFFFHLNKWDWLVCSWGRSSSLQFTWLVLDLVFMYERNPLPCFSLFTGNKIETQH